MCLGEGALREVVILQRSVAEVVLDCTFANGPIRTIPTPFLYYIYLFASLLLRVILIFSGFEAIFGFCQRHSTLDNQKKCSCMELGRFYDGLGATGNLKRLLDSIKMLKPLNFRGLRPLNPPTRPTSTGSTHFGLKAADLSA